MTRQKKSTADNPIGMYLSEWNDRELQLSRLHEEIVSKRESLLSCSASYHHSQEQRQRQGTQAPEQAYLRNQRLLQDIRSAQERLFESINSSPTPRFMTLQKNYWAMVRSQVPMWEQDLGIQRSKYKSRAKSKSPSRQNQPAQPKQKTSKKQRRSREHK